MQASEQLRSWAHELVSMASAGLEFVTNDYDRDRFVRTGRVALIKRADNGRWALPGGYAEVGSPPSENALRELREETGRTSSLRRGRSQHAGRDRRTEGPRSISAASARGSPAVAHASAVYQ